MARAVIVTNGYWVDPEGEPNSNGNIYLFLDFGSGETSYFAPKVRNGTKEIFLFYFFVIQRPDLEVLDEHFGMSAPILVYFSTMSRFSSWFSDFGFFVVARNFH